MNYCRHLCSSFITSTAEVQHLAILVFVSLEWAAGSILTCTGHSLKTYVQRVKWIERWWVGINETGGLASFGHLAHTKGLSSFLPGYRITCFVWLTLEL